MAEVPHMPTRDEILERAIELFMYEHPEAPTPEEYELKEGNYFERARLDIMTGVRSELEKYLAYLESEADRIREELDIEKPLPPEERISELELELSTLSERHKTAVKRRKEAEAELKRIRETLPPPPPPPPPTGLGPDEKRRLEDAFKRAFAEAGVTRLPPMALAAFRDELGSLQEELKDIPRERAFRLARRRIIDLAGTMIKPPVPPPPVAPPPTPPPEWVPPAELLGPRRVEVTIRTCWGPGPPHTFEADKDLERRVRLVPVIKADTPALGPRYEPLLRFPPLFYMLCPEHRFEKFGYRDVYDALGFLLAETKRSRMKRLTVTKETLIELGLTTDDLRTIQFRAERWIERESQGPA